MKRKNYTLSKVTPFILQFIFPPTPRRNKWSGRFSRRVRKSRYEKAAEIGRVLAVAKSGLKLARILPDALEFYATSFLPLPFLVLPSLPLASLSFSIFCFTAVLHSATPSTLSSLIYPIHGVGIVSLLNTARRLPTRSYRIFTTKYIHYTFSII